MFRQTATILLPVIGVTIQAGIAALFVGPYDLATAPSGGREQDVTAPAVEQAIDKICAAAKKAGKFAGIYCADAERALAMAKRGFRFITIGSDLAIVRGGAAAQVNGLIGE